MSHRPVVAAVVSVAIAACSGARPLPGGATDAGADSTGSSGSSSGAASSSGTASSSGAGSSSGSSGGPDASSGGTDSGSGSGAGEGGALDGGDPATCAQAAANRSYVGCDYWPTVTANNVWSIFDFAVVVANAGTHVASVTVTGPSATHQTTTVAPGQLTTLYLPWVPALKGSDSDSCGTATPFASSVLAPASAYHLVSSVPVIVYQ
ncbi:MAG: hypothetical protein ACRELB_08885, partial [Polyangiaceae bacterium]